MFTDLEANFGLHPPSQLVLAGQDVTLPCIPPKSNPPPVIVWYKNDSEMMQPGHMLFTYPGSTNLVLSDIQYSDHAYYHCVAYNHLALPQSRESSAAHIIVYGKIFNLWHIAYFVLFLILPYHFFILANFNCI